MDSGNTLINYKQAEFDDFDIPNKKEKPLADNLDPQSRYYDVGGIEVLNVIKAKLTEEQYIGYLLGNSIKYNLRFNWKHTTLEGKVRDAQKMELYAKNLRLFMGGNDE